MFFVEFCSQDSVDTSEKYALEAETIKFIAGQQSEATIKSNSVNLNRVTAFCRERWISMNIPSQKLSELLALFHEYKENDDTGYEPIHWVPFSADAPQYA